MAVAVTNNQKAAIPALTMMQFDPGAISSSVNLFRGNLAFPLKLLSLPGRGGSSADVTLTYQSDVHTSVEDWNLTSPTGVAGLGWSLPLEKISVDPRGNAIAADNAYYLSHQGQTIPLIPVPQDWTRTVLPAGHGLNLQPGPAPAALTAALAEAGWPVSSRNRLVTATTPGAWLLYDDDAQRSYWVRSQPDGSLSLESGGQSYDMQTFQFWQITFYPEYNRWEVIQPTGVRFSYGGTPDPGSDDPHWIQWGVRWGNWVGPSVRTNGWTRYPTAWNLATAEDTTGHRTLYAYRVTERPLATSAARTQATAGNASTSSTSSPTYTSDCQLAEITNDLGWSCHFVYGSKTCDSSRLDAPKEYLVPELDPTLAPDTPTAWQAPIATLYLDSIIVANDRDETQATLRFAYYPLTNLTAYDPDNLLAYGATYKRFLKSIVEELPNGASRPDIQFVYELSTDANRNRGALTSILYPTGAVTRFIYDTIDVGGGDGDQPGARNLTISNPFGATAQGHARVWYGADYVVCGWLSDSASELRLNVYTWLGRWAPAFANWVRIPGSWNVDTLQAAASRNSFILALPKLSGTSTSLFTFHRHPAAAATWIPSTTKDGTLSTCSYGTSTLGIVQGTDFFLVTDNDNLVCDRFAWNWMTDSWKITHLADKNTLCPAGTGSSYVYYTAACDNYYMLFCYNRNTGTGRFKLFWRDPLLAWNAGGTLDTSAVSIPSSGSFSYFQMTPGPSYVALAFVTGFTKSGSTINKVTYQLAVLTWDTDYGALAFAALPDVFDGETFRNVPVNLVSSLGPVVSPQGSLVGSGPNLFLYDGVSWSFHTMGIDFSGFNDPSAQYYWYGYGDTAAIKTENTVSGLRSTLCSFDPSRPDAGWSTQVLEDLHPPMPANRYTLGFPTLAPTVASQGSTVYPRSVWPGWTDAPPSLRTDLVGTGIDTTTVVNQAPYFLAWMTTNDQGTPRDTRILFFRNGGVVRQADGTPRVEVFDGQQMFRFLDRTHRYRTALSGKLPAIPNGFITFPANSTNDLTTAITLHHYANDSVQAPIRAWVVRATTADSGLETLERCYAYTDVSAATDPTGTVIQFETVTEYQACSDPTQQRYGFSTSRFYNGLPPQAQGLCGRLAEEHSTDPDQNYSLLTGLLRAKEVCDTAGTLVSSSVNTWTVANSVAITPDGASQRTLYMGIPQVAGTVETQDGVTCTLSFTYDPAAGTPSLAETSSYDSRGQQVFSRRRSRFGFQVYPELWSRHILVPVAEARLDVRCDQDPADQWTVEAIQVNTFKAWPRSDGTTYWAEADTWIPRTADAPAFTGWTGGTPDADWLTSRRITRRGDAGTVELAWDVQNRPAVTLYDDQGRFAVASFTNAADGVTYDGFEPYQTSAWTFGTAGAATVITADSFTGACCLQLTAAGTLGRTLAAPTYDGGDDSRAIFGLWLKAPADPGTLGVTLTVSAGRSGTVLRKALTIPRGTWQAAQWVLDLAGLGLGAGLADATLSLGLEVTGADVRHWLRVDDLWFAPLTAEFGAMVYDAGRLLRTETLAANGVCLRRLFNAFYEPAIAVTPGTEGAADCVRSLATPFFARQIADMAAGAPFPADNPNATLTVSGQDAGFFDPFKDGALDAYDVADGSAGDWRAADRTLSFSGNSDAPMGTRVVRRGFAASSLAISVIVETAAGAAPDGTVSVGTGRYGVRWTGRQWELVAENSGVENSGAGGDGNPSVSVLATSTATGWQRQWLLLVFDTRILFYANGARLFSYDADAVAAAPHGVQLGLGRPAGFRTLAVLETIGLTVNYQDGLSRSLQSLSMESGRSVILASGLYDDRSNPAIQIPPARVTTGTVANPFAYYAGYVTNGGLDSPVWQGAPLTGPVADIYHPDDGGYPFARTAFEASPLNRPIAAGLPGAAFALRSGNPHVTTWAYGTNHDAGPFLYALPIGQYHTVTMIDADGTTTWTVTDTTERTIGTVVTPAGGGTRWITSTVCDTLGRPVASVPPGCYAAPPNQGGVVQGGPIPPGATTATFNFLGQRITTTDPDTGTSRCLYSVASQPRFMQDADGAANGYFLYCKYDSRGSRVEEGWVAGTWDAAALQAKADDDPTWPDPGDGSAGGGWYVRHTYDGTDATPCMAGRLWRVEVNNSGANAGEDIGPVAGAPAGQTTAGRVTDTWMYDVSGNTVAQTRAAADFADGEAVTLSFTYSAAGALRSTTDSVSGVTSRSARDPLLRVTAVTATTGNRTVCLARTTYAPTGKPQNTVVMPDNGAPITRQYSYASPEWPQIIRDQAMEETLQYTEEACGGGGYWTGVVAHQTVSLKGDTPHTDSRCFTVDGLGRITATAPSPGADAGAGGTGNGGMSWTLGPNGTILARTSGQTTETFTYGDTGAGGTGSNRLTKVTPAGGGTGLTLTYTDAGVVRRIDQSGQTSMTLACGRSSGNAARIDQPGNSVASTLTFQYGATGHRALKTVTGSGGYRLFQIDRGGESLRIQDGNPGTGGSNRSVIRQIATPDLTVLCIDGRFHFGLTDHLGSIRVVVDESGAVEGQYAYDTYGGTVVLKTPPFPWTTLYTGQTYDSETGLYAFHYRLYHPGLNQFLMPDPLFETPSPYAYAANNPLVLTDPDGLSAGGIAAGILVGTVLSVGIGVLGVLTCGAGFAAAAVVGAVAGALGTTAGDLTTAGIDGERITGKRVGVDLLAGAAGGAAGALAGGAAGQLTARGAMAMGAGVRGMTAATSLASGMSGGVAGAFASSGVTAAFYNQPLFSTATATNMAIGFATGFGAGAMAAGAHLGWTRLGGDVGVYPVKLAAPKEIRSINPVEKYGEVGGLKGEVRILAPKDGLTTGLRNRWQSWIENDDFMTAQNWETELTQIQTGGGVIDVDVVAMHGVPQYALAEWQAPNGQAFNRPITGRTLGQFLREEGYGQGRSNRPVKLVSCFGAMPGRFSIAQSLANELRVDVYAQRGVVDPFGNTRTGPWIRFQPR